MDITKRENREVKIKTTVLGVLFLLYNIGLLQPYIMISNLSSLVFLIMTAIVVWDNAKKSPYQDKKIHFFIMGLLFNWIFRNILHQLNPNLPIVAIFRVDALIHMILCFSITAYIFASCAKKLHISQLILDGVLIQSILVSIGISVQYFHNWSFELPVWKNVVQYTYHFFELMTVSLILVIFTSFRNRKLSKHNTLILSSVMMSISLRYLYQIGLIVGNETYIMLVEALYLLPPGLLLLASEFIRSGSRVGLFEIGSDENRIIDNRRKSYLVLSLGVLSLVLYMRNWISDIVMIFILIMLFSYHVMNHAVQKAFKTEKRLQDEERKRKQLEYEVDRRTKELQRSNEELKEKNELLGDLIYFDMNLGLYTIRYLQENLQSWNAEHALTLIAIDIKDFKNINSLFSYAVGDKVLSHISFRLKEKYNKGAILFRLNSNKFGILFLKELTEVEIKKIADEIYNLGQTPIELGEINIRVKFSIGIATYERRSEDVQKILESAEYAEREAHRMIEEHSYQIFDREIERKIEREKAIRRLLEDIDFNQEFELHYQPQCDVEGNLLGMEALLRWTSPELGKVSPGEFIPIAEQSAVILRIAQWTLRQGIEQIKKWNTKYGTNYRVGINISTKFIENSSFLKYVQTVIAEFGIPAEWLDLEVTETSLINMNKDIIRLFEELAEIGVSISIDDFGTGYSSLSYINSFRISNIKIARELVESIVTDPKESALVKAIIMMANSLELDIIAEGVEEKNQLQTLAILGCGKIQGYYFGRPQSAADFEKAFISNLNKAAV